MNDTRQIHQNEIPSLNGIRAVSVMIVFLSHAGFERLVPGRLGVTIFFFLSGFLITTLMIREHSRFGSIDIRAFYIRRFLRLMPPLLIALAVAYGLTYAGILPGNITLEGIAAQLLYFANYLEIFFQGSEKIPTGTGVLWSLAVEEHFYILFPLIMAAAFSFGATNRSKILVAAALCLAVLSWRSYLVYGLGVPEARTYYGSDTRIDSIIYGCILAFAMNGRMQDDRGDARLSPMEWGALVAAGLLMLTTFAVRDPQFRETLRYSFQGIALLPFFYLAVRRHRSWVFWLLNTPVAVKVGIYSYSIYLIHRVIIVMLADNFPVLQQQTAVLAAISLACSVGFAALVDRYVDSRLRKRRQGFHLASRVVIAR
jgi:peptidoglycan/LPS O-acetylase OafA/YrhL